MMKTNFDGHHETSHGCTHSCTHSQQTSERYSEQFDSGIHSGSIETNTSSFESRSPFFMDKTPVQCSDAYATDTGDPYCNGKPYQPESVGLNQNNFTADELEAQFLGLNVDDSADEGLHSMHLNVCSKTNYTDNMATNSQQSSDVSSSGNNCVQQTSYCSNSSRQHRQNSPAVHLSDGNGSCIIEADLCQQDADGDTILHVAVVNGFKDFSIGLINISAGPTCLNIQNNLFQAPIHIAVLTDQNEIVSALVAKGANVSLRDHHGNTPVHIACSKANKLVVETLICAFGCDMNKLRKYFAIKNREGLTCLHVAGLSGNIDIVNVLVRNGADINIGDGKSGRSLLHYAAECNNIRLVRSLIEDTECDIDCKTFKGETPLMLAFWRNHQDIVKLLRNCGAFFSYEMFESSDEELSS